jgi:protein-L-isoaspartate(D-aspartate) O-methyltransferase
VPDEWRADAYADRALPIGFRQTISQPYVVALMTELLEPRKELRVLEIGTGSGYQAAVLAALVRHVYTIEIVPELARMVSERLRSMGYRNITARQGDGYEGWREQAPFDRVILTAAPREIPTALLDQLKPGGKLVAPVGDSPMNQELVVVDKGLDGRIHRRPVIPIAFVPMVKSQTR